MKLIYCRFKLKVARTLVIYVFKSRFFGRNDLPDVHDFWLPSVNMVELEENVIYFL